MEEQPMTNRISRLLILSAAFGLLVSMAVMSSAEDLLSNADGTPGLDRWLAYHDKPIENVSDVWQIQDGILTCKGLPRGYLYTKEKYTDFVLKLQWRWPPDGKPGNGGVLFRTTGPHKVWPKCLEVQINNGAEGDFVGIDGYRFNGPKARFRVIDHPKFGQIRFLTKTQSAAKPLGQWNEFEIIAEGGTVTQRLNGKQVNQATDCDVVAGPVLLTAENDPIQFRNIELTPMDK